MWVDLFSNNEQDLGMWLGFKALRVVEPVALLECVVMCTGGTTPLFTL